MRVLASIIGATAAVVVVQQTLAVPDVYHDNHRSMPFITKSSMPEKTTPVYSCRENFERRGKECVREIQVAPLAHCKTGELIKGICAEESALQRRCPEGYYSTCDAVKPKDYGQRHHSHGSHHDKGGCRCLREEQAEKLSKCPAGYLSTEGGQCAKESTLPLIYVCPEGYACDYKSRGPQNCNSCSKLLTAPLESYCPDNTYERDGVCIEEVPAPLYYECPAGTFCENTQGHKKSGNCQKCVTYEYVEKGCSCPKGLPDVNGVCKLEEEYDCSPDPRCNYLTNGKRIRNLVAKKPTKAGGTHHENHGGKQEDICVVQKTCKRIKTAAPVCSCPPGYTEQYGYGHHQKGYRTCAKTVYVDALPICSAGGSIENCVKQQTAAKTYKCPDGYTSSCTGAKHRGGKKHGKYHSSHQSCSCNRQEFTEPIAECPVEGGDVENCFETEYTSPLYYCPEGYATLPLKVYGASHGKRYHNHDHHHVKLESDVCVKTEYAEWDQYCEEGLVQEGSRCLSLTPPSYKCPSTSYQDKASSDSSDLYCSYFEYAPPYATYQVTHTKSCIGKDCALGGAATKEKKHYKH